MRTEEDVKSFLTGISREYSARTAFWFHDGRKFTYEQFFCQVNILAGELEEMLETKNRIAVAADNSEEWILYFWALLWLGKCTVLLDPEMPEEDRRESIKDLGISTVFVKEASGDWKDEAEIYEMKKCGRTSADFFDFQENCSMGMEAGKEAVILLTTGTTGKHKGVRLSQRNIAKAIIPGVMEDAEAVFLALPLFHSLALNALITAMYLGCTVCIGRGAKYLMKDIRYFSPDAAVITPIYMSTFYKKILRHTGGAGPILGEKLKSFIVGGASAKQTLIHQFEAFDIYTRSVYGSSETFCIASGAAGGQEGCVGRMAGHMESVVDNGEILVKGPTVFLGYTDESGDRDPNEWYRTGDLGKTDEEGRLFLTGRKKNLIIRSNGKNISPELLERELYKISTIEEVVVFENDDKICAEIYLGENDSTETRASVQGCIWQMNMQRPMYDQIQKIVFREQPFSYRGIGKIKRVERNGQEN